MAYPCTLYVNSSAPDYLDKTLSGGVTLSCDFKAPIDIERPTIYVSGGASLDGYNYIHIPEFGRYYFAKPVGGTGNTITFECESDPMMSFKDQIRACPAVISRNPWHWDMYLPDPKLPVEARTISAIKKFPENHFRGNNNCYVLTVLGG